MSAPITVTTDNPSGEPGALKLQPSLRRAGGVFFKASHGTDGALGHLDASAARDLGAWLVKRYGLSGWVPAKGDTVRILPGAERYDGVEVEFPDVTRAKVAHGPDSDGEYSVEIIDGDDAGETFYVAAAFLVHSDAILPEDAKPEAPKPTPAPRFAVGTPAVIVTDNAGNGVTAGLPKGTLVVINGNMPSGNYRVTAHIGGVLKTRYVRATDVALSLPAEEPAKDATPTTPAALKVGDVVELKPSPKTRYGGGVYFGADVTRVKVTALPYGEDGDYEVRNLDGTGPHGSRDADTQYVGRAYLGDPITDAAAWAVGDEAIVTVGGKYVDGFSTGERVRLIAVNAPCPTDGFRQVHATSTERAGVTWYTRTDAIRRP